MILEQFIREVFPDSRAYLYNKEDIIRVATLAKNYSLIHQSYANRTRPTWTPPFFPLGNWEVNLESHTNQDGSDKQVPFNDNRVRSRDCFYCERPVLIMSDDRYSNLAVASNPLVQSHYSK